MGAQNGQDFNMKIQLTVHPQNVLELETLLKKLPDTDLCQVSIITDTSVNQIPHALTKKVTGFLNHPLLTMLLK